jgi:predicted NAD-dependent protein-ADP-ribosyltransferase YbiA (DUF1768 family)
MDDNAHDRKSWAGQNILGEILVAVRDNLK